LQQALEKLVPVKRLELFVKSHDALAELESQADAGILLLRTEPFIFDGATITFTEQARKAPPPPKKPAQQDPPASALSFAPRNARRPGKAIGKGRQAPPDKTIAAVARPTSDSSRDQGDFRAMVAAKNKQREAKLALANGSQVGDKRPAAADEDGDHDAKKPKTD